jgi:hypothetical protein
LHPHGNTETFVVFNRRFTRTVNKKGVCGYLARSRSLAIDLCVLDLSSLGWAAAVL